MTISGNWTGIEDRRHLLESGAHALEGLAQMSLRIMAADANPYAARRALTACDEGVGRGHRDAARRERAHEAVLGPALGDAEPGAQRIRVRGSDDRSDDIGEQRLALPRLVPLHLQEAFGRAVL